MRLINTETLELEEFRGITPRYAILSHTWAEGEVSFQEWQRAKRTNSFGLPSSSTSSSPRIGGPDVRQTLPIYSSPPTDRFAFDEILKSLAPSRNLRPGYWKILKACFQARKDGLLYLWVDTNCIDKTSSAELSEAINSMYAWYRDSSACYAYLADVPLATYDSLHAPGSLFRASRWFTRGWCLQELIAPQDGMLFFSGDWTRLGTKSSLSGLLSEITGIEERYLLKVEGIRRASIAQRMSWVSNRATTRPEDIAYCMLGIFDVNMALIYGEGSKAFIRLQEEIIKMSEDHSIFAWTWLPQLSDRVVTGGRAREFTFEGELTRARPQRNFPQTRLASLGHHSRWTSPERPTMLAPDPLAFFDSGSFPTLAPSTGVAPFTITNAGLSISLPIITQGDGELLFAVIHSSKDSKTEEQTIICIPLSKHYRQKHRYTRTCFPPSPITITRRMPSNVNHLYLSDFWMRNNSQSIYISRDVQYASFYYQSFGGTAHTFGFWFFLPNGWAEFKLVGGYVTPNGVFNDYGLFVDYPGGSTAPQRAGGLLAFQGPHRRTTMIFLSTTIWYSSHPSNSERSGTCVRILDADCLPGDLEKMFQDISYESNVSGVQQNAAHGRNGQVFLHNSAALSHSPFSNIILTEIDFTRRGDP